MIYCQYVSYNLLQKKDKKNQDTFYDSWRVEPTTGEVNTLRQKMTKNKVIKVKKADFNLCFQT